VLGLGLPLQPQRHAVDAGVQYAHDGQRDPEVAELQQRAEDGLLQVLDVAHAVRHSSITDEILPADNRREEDEYGNNPDHRDDR